MKGCPDPVVPVPIAALHHIRPAALSVARTCGQTLAASLVQIQAVEPQNHVCNRGWGRKASSTPGSDLLGLSKLNLSRLCSLSPSGLSVPLAVQVPPADCQREPRAPGNTHRIRDAVIHSRPFQRAESCKMLFPFAQFGTERGLLVHHQILRTRAGYPVTLVAARLSPSVGSNG